MVFRTVSEFLALTGKERPTPAEVKLVEAVRAGERCEISKALPETEPLGNTVRGSLLRLLITGATPACGTQDFGVWLEGGWIEGLLDLSFAKARGGTVLVACRFTNRPVMTEADLNKLSLGRSYLPGLFAQGMQVRGSLLLSRAKSYGTVDLIAAKIGGQLNCDGAELFCPENEGKRGKALNAQGVEIKDSLFLCNVRAEGTVDVAGAKIGGQMNCKMARFVCLENEGKRGVALNAQRLNVHEDLLWWDVTVTSGTSNFAAAHVGDLADDGSSSEIADMLVLNGLTYDRIVGDKAPVTAAGRRAWLRAGSVLDGRFYPQPYTQLARVLRNMGHGGEARTVLFWREGLVAAQVRRDVMAAPVGPGDMAFGPLGREVLAAGLWAGSGILRVVAGYGYKPFRAFWCLCALWFAAFLLADQVWDRGQFAPNSDVVLTSAGWQAALAGDCVKDPGLALPDPCEANPANKWSSDPLNGMDWESFSAIGYALDLVVPLIDLGQTDAWAPSKDRGSWGFHLWWGRWVFEVLGWLVTALGAAAVTGIMQRERE